MAETPGRATPYSAPSKPQGSGSQDRYRQLVESFPMGTYVLDGEGRVQEANRALGALWGGPREELLGRRFLELVAERDRERVLERFRARLAGELGDREELEFRALTKTGEERICRLHSAPVVEAGAVVGSHGVVVDITESRRTEEALRSSEEQFRLMVEGSEQVFFFVHDTRGVFEYLSPSVKSVVGYAPEQMVGRRYEEFHPYGAIRDEVHELTQEGLSGQRDGPYEAVLTREDGALVHLEITESPVVVDGRVRGMQGFARDVTHRKQLEEELRQSQKMEAVGQLAGGVAHDFNNLLTTIMGHVALMQQRLPAEHDMREDLEEVQRSSERAADVTRQLLAFSRKQVLRPHVLDLNQVVEELERLLRRLIGEHITLSTRLAPDPLRVLADSGQLEQVVMNLVVNARDAMQGGGEVEIVTTRVPDSVLPVSGDTGVPVPGVRLSVRDTGVGMSEAVRARAFEPFYTTKGQGEGTGLGLSTVYGIVTQTGGAVWIESEPGIGTTLHAEFPEARGPITKSRLAVEDVPPGRGTVLVVEDEDGVRNLCLKVLRHHGYEVLGAQNGRAALDLLEDGAKVDLLLSDVVMPGLNGPDVLRAARQHHPEVRGAFMSGYTEAAVARHGIFDETPHFLEKPFTAQQLLRVVHAALAGPDSGSEGS